MRASSSSSSRDSRASSLDEEMRDVSRDFLDVHRPALVKARLVDHIIREIRTEAADASDDDALDARARETCERFARAFTDARATRESGLGARERRETKIRAGRCLTAATRRRGASSEFATLADLARFVAMGDEGDASSLSERALRRGMRGMLAKAHAEGRAVASGAVACEDAFDLAVTSRGFFRENWGVVVEEAMPRAVRAVRRRFGLDRAREGVREETGRETRDDALDAWLFAARDRGEDSDSDSVSSADEDEDEDEDERRLYSSSSFVARARRGSISTMDDDEDEDEDEDERKRFIRVEGAEIRHVERDHEYVVREIAAMRGESTAEIAERIKANVERTEGAKTSVEARRARLLQSLLAKYTRVESSRNSHTGAHARDMTSNNPKHAFFAGTETRTRIVTRNKNLEFRSVKAHIDRRKNEIAARETRRAMLFGK
mgnify:CR=1 FL=1